MHWQLGLKRDDCVDLPWLRWSYSLRNQSSPWKDLIRMKSSQGQRYQLLITALTLEDWSNHKTLRRIHWNWHLVLCLLLISTDIQRLTLIDNSRLKTTGTNADFTNSVRKRTVQHSNSLSTDVKPSPKTQGSKTSNETVFITQVLWQNNLNSRSDSSFFQMVRPHLTVLICRGSLLSCHRDNSLLSLCELRSLTWGQFCQSLKYVQGYFQRLVPVFFAFHNFRASQLW